MSFSVSLSSQESSSRHHHHDHHLVLQSSLSQTYRALMQNDPQAVEQDHIRRAMELSLLDCALVVIRRPHDNRVSSSCSTTTDTTTTTTNTLTGGGTTATGGTKSDSLGKQDLYQILGLPQQPPQHPQPQQQHQPQRYTLTDIKAAYRQRARQTHPDRPGGNEAAFQQVARAYRSLVRDYYQQQQEPSSCNYYYNSSSSSSSPKQLKGTAHWDKELVDHQRLVQELFTGSHPVSLHERRTVQQNVLDHVLVLQTRNAGSTHTDETHQILYNSCFYLSLAASYLAGIGALLDEGGEYDYEDDDDEQANQQGTMTASTFGPEDRYLIGETALHLKRTIEAAVLRAHPEWAVQGKIGDHVQAFADFLVYLLDRDPAAGTFVSEWAVVVFDTTSGVADVYKGHYYNEDERPETAASHCLTLRYIPGHYEVLLPRPPWTTNPRPTLSQILQVLDANNIFYVVTDGATP